jgi:hypothetical protein
LVEATMMGNSNEGIQVFGGSFHANIVGVGAGVRVAVRDARQSLHERRLDEVAEKLDQLVHAVEAHAHMLDDQDRAQVMEETEEVARELAAPAPHGANIAATLGRLAQAAGSVLSIATAAEGLQAVVTRLT